jgi:hypothetical protein
MKKNGNWLAAIVMVVGLGGALLADSATAGKTYYAVEFNGVLCGYSEGSETPVREQGRRLVRAESNVLFMMTLLGSAMNSRITAVSLLDPRTRRARRIRTVIDHGTGPLVYEMTAGANEVTLVTPKGNGPKHIPVSAATLLNEEELFLRLKRDFLEKRLSEASYDIFEIIEEEVQRSTFRKVQEERLELAGRSFPAMAIEKLNSVNGGKTVFWISADYDDFIKFSVRGRVVYLADRRVVDRIKVADMDAAIFTKTNAAIADFQAIAYMKLQARIAPTGMVLTAADLNVPGQKFSGSVKDNEIDGVFEIEQRRYDGSQAPPFPAGFAKDPALRKYLQPGPSVESDDPELARKAREITAGAADSWQAAVRLSRWVAENIAYGIIANNSARRAYDGRAGECGAHSMLLAAFCRAVGIPARIVFGAMYVPNQGGGFGQHAWNEVYMGAAGWIPVDATAYEVDTIDAGHIRIGEVHSLTASTFNGRTITVLEHRLAGVSAAAALDLTPFLGKFAMPRGERTFSVLEKDGGLALDIPGRLVLPFHAGDAKGRWLCKLAPHIYLVFHREGQERASAMDLHQIVMLPRKADAAAAALEAAAELAPYLGGYVLPGTAFEFLVQADQGRLTVYDPTREETVRLLPPGAAGGWREENTANMIFFERDGQGKVTALKVDAVDSFLRGEMAADQVGQEIDAKGLEAGRQRFGELRAAGRPDVFFSEASFNQLGYRLLTAGKLSEAIAVFQLNVEAYPGSFNVYDSLGEAYMKNGQNDLAIANFKRSLELNPKNGNARKMLEQLGVR